jgi:hypothetical protein
LEPAFTLFIKEELISAKRTITSIAARQNPFANLAVPVLKPVIVLSTLAAQARQFLGFGGFRQDAFALPLRCKPLRFDRRSPRFP